MLRWTFESSRVRRHLDLHKGYPFDSPVRSWREDASNPLHRKLGRVGIQDCLLLIQHLVHPPCHYERSVAE